MMIMNSPSSDSLVTSENMGPNNIMLTRCDEDHSISSISCGMSLEEHNLQNYSARASFEEEAEPSLSESMSGSTISSSSDAEHADDASATSTDEEESLSSGGPISRNSSFSLRHSMIGSSLSSLLDLLSNADFSFEQTSVNTTAQSTSINTSASASASKSASMTSTTHSVNTFRSKHEEPSSDELPIPRHELSSFLRVSRHLLSSESTNNSLKSPTTSASSLALDKDVINEVLKALELDLKINQGDDVLLPVVPPSPPQFSSRRDPTKAALHESDNKNKRTPHKVLIESHLPKEFVCPLCNDIIIGAVVLDCRCNASTCCMGCIEKVRKEAQLNPEEKECDDEDEEFVLVKTPPTASDRQKAISCPSCYVTYNNIVQCNPLDVAILNVVQNLRSTSDGMTRDHVREVQFNFYDRLSEWRTEVLLRHESVARQREELRKLLLNQLIQEEKEVMKRTRIKKRRWVVVREVTLFAAAALVGINTILRKK